MCRLITTVILATTVCGSFSIAQSPQKDDPIKIAEDQIVKRFRDHYWAKMDDAQAALNDFKTKKKGVTKEEYLAAKKKISSLKKASLSELTISFGLTNFVSRFAPYVRDLKVVAIRDGFALIDEDALYGASLNSVPTTDALGRITGTTDVATGGYSPRFVVPARGLKVGKTMKMPVIIEAKLTADQVRGFGFSYINVDPYFRATIGKVNTSLILKKIRKKE